MLPKRTANSKQRKDTRMQQLWLCTGYTDFNSSAQVFSQDLPNSRSCAPPFHPETAVPVPDSAMFTIIVFSAPASEQWASQEPDLHSPQTPKEREQILLPYAYQGMWVGPNSSARHRILSILIFPQPHHRKPRKASLKTKQKQTKKFKRSSRWNV